MKKSILVMLLTLMFFAVNVTAFAEVESSEGFTLQVYTDLEITSKTQIAIGLTSELTRLSPVVQGGENITIDFYSDGILVGHIENGVVTYAIDFLPGYLYVEITGNPGDVFDISFTFKNR